MLFSWWAATQGVALQIHFVQEPDPQPPTPHTHIQRHTHIIHSNSIHHQHQSATKRTYQIELFEWNVVCLDRVGYPHVNVWFTVLFLFHLSGRGMPFNWGLEGDVASIGLPQSKASPPMLISQGQEEPLQCFSFEGGLKIQQQEPCCTGGGEENTQSNISTCLLRS